MSCPEDRAVTTDRKAWQGGANRPAIFFATFNIISNGLPFLLIILVVSIRVFHHSLEEIVCFLWPENESTGPSMTLRQGKHARLLR